MAKENTDQTDAPTSSERKKKATVPPEGYVCKLCSVPGHWIQQCSEEGPPTNKSEKKKRKSSEHEYQPGVDPSPQDIERAKNMQQLKPPECDCGTPSRLKKVKRSKVAEKSRANGSYFFFCAKKRGDETKCNFVQPVVDIKKTEKEKNQSNFFAKKRKKA
jgi:hypothetical protein